MEVCSVDNVLAKVGDPVFIGFCDTCKARGEGVLRSTGKLPDSEADAGLKTMEKVLPEVRSFAVCPVDFQFEIMRCLLQEQYGIFCSQLYRDVFEDVDGDGKLDSVSKVKASVLEFFEIPEDSG